MTGSEEFRTPSALPGAPNVTFLMDEDLSSVYFEELNTEVYGFSYHTAEITEAKADNSLPASRRTRILMLHGGDAKHVPLTGMHWLHPRSPISPLGHIHKPEVLLETAWPTQVPRNRST